jgi:uncharacterized protein with HEPN domain
MAKDAAIAIRDCLAEIAVLEEIASRVALDEFKSDAILRRGAAYAIQTVSEAVRSIPDEWLADYPAVPWSEIKSIGNRIRHEYYRLDDAILWQIITTETNALKAVLEDMLAKHSGQGRN